MLLVSGESAHHSGSGNHRNAECRQQGQQEIHRRTSERHPDHIRMRPMQIMRIHRHGLRPADDWRSSDHAEQDEESAEWVHMLDRIQRQSASPTRRLIAELQGHIAVGELMQRQRKEQGWQADSNGLDDTGNIHTR